MMIYLVIIGVGVFFSYYSANDLLRKKHIKRFLKKKEDKKNIYNGLFYRLHVMLVELGGYFNGFNNSNRMINSILLAIYSVVVLFANVKWHIFPWFSYLPAAGLLYIVAVFLIGRRAARRYFDDHFPEVLSIMTAAISSGASIHEGLKRCGVDITGPLGAEFNRIVRRLNVGEDPDKVFADAWNTFNYKEFYFFSTVMLVSIKRGGQLKLLITRLSRIVSDAKTMERRRNSLTSEARMSAKIVAAIPIGFLFLMKFTMPDNFDFIMNSDSGRFILYYMIGSVSIGIGIISFLIKRAT
ncbi:type II secretion system F family protein [Aeromonas finlandensis]|uniref:type II secretion system F family protein n=1 Tax=Aeromonas finlandensis TaxID=1543375 RepID=UPI00067CCD92|nr:type II secretion system F family protein [Aeromonas finlandensis]